MSEFYHSWTDPNSNLQLIIEDDGRVAYAYLLQNKRIIADVWLYNQAPTPTKPEWRDHTKMPFLNPSEYCFHPTDFVPLVQIDEVSVEWLKDRIVIRVRGLLFASLLVGQKIGASRFVSQNGPLAKILSLTGQN